MKWNTCSIVVLLSVLVLSSVSHASDNKSVLVTQNDKNITTVKDQKNALNDAVNIYLEKNPPKLITEFIYSAIEKAQTASVPDADRDKVVSHIKENVTPEK